jgi:branched-chain amino acid transport system substrate-binding protein
LVEAVLRADPPNAGMVQAGTYSAVLHYLRSMQASGTVDGKAVAEKIRELPVDDFFAKGRVRDDGPLIHDMYLVEVKKPNESKGSMGLLQGSPWYPR